jgi:hypothetical protein
MVGEGAARWGWACEVLTDAQLASLEQFTRHNLAIANETI